MWNAQLDEAQAEIKTAEGTINNLRYADDTSLMTESKEELKGLLMKVKEEREKAGLKLNIQKQRSWHLAPSITWWQIEGGKVEAVIDFLFTFCHKGGVICISKIIDMLMIPPLWQKAIGVVSSAYQ